MMHIEKYDCEQYFTWCGQGVEIIEIRNDVHKSSIDKFYDSYWSNMQVAIPNQIESKIEQ